MQVMDQREGGKAIDIYPFHVGDGLTEQATRTLVWCSCTRRTSRQLGSLHCSERPGILLIGWRGAWLATRTRPEQPFAQAGDASREVELAPRGGSWN